MPAVYDLANRGLLPPGFSLVGFARRDWADQDFAKIVHDAVHGARADAVPRGGLEAALRRVPLRSGRLLRRRRLQPAARHHRGARPRARHGGQPRLLPLDPAAASSRTWSDSSRSTGSPRTTAGSWRRVVVEKPFGHDLKSAQELNAIVSEVFPPESVFRIDHYLGKETVQNILALRFANQLFEPVWNANYVDHVQITMAEDIGIGGRAGYYDGIGAARDVIQNHLLQLMALIAMEEPVSFDAQQPADREAEDPAQRPAPDAARPAHLPRSVRRRLGRRREGRAVSSTRTDIPRTSKTETFAAIKLEIDTRRWAGVPFYLRTRQAARSPRHRGGGGLQACAAPAVHRDRDRGARPERPRHPGPARRRRDDAVRRPRCPGTAMEIRDVNMDFAYGGAFVESSPEAYERLILDVLLGDPPLFPQHEEVELSWQILDPILDYWAEQGKPEQLRVGHLGPGVVDRDAGPRRPRLAQAVEGETDEHRADRHQREQDRQRPAGRAPQGWLTRHGHGPDVRRRHRRGRPLRRDEGRASGLARAPVAGPRRHPAIGPRCGEPRRGDQDR